MKHIIIFFITFTGFLLPFFVDAQALNTYQFEQIDSLLHIEKRPMVLFIYTDWCRYCKNMEQTTFQDEKIVHQLNEKFYFINLNAEEKRPIIFRNHTFLFKPTGMNNGVHALAEALGNMNGQLSYPTLCILNPDYEIIFQYNAFLNAKNLNVILDKILD